MTAERSELQILGFRDLGITSFRSLDIRAICLTACILPILAMQHRTTNLFYTSVSNKKQTMYINSKKVDYQNYI